MNNVEAEVNPNLAYSATPVAVPEDAAAATTRKLEAVLARFEITIAEANDLVVLQDYEIVVIADDSGSMECPALPAAQRRLGVPCPTRWDELKATVAEIVEIASCFDESGIDLYFLNRPAVLGVKHATDTNFVEAFQRGPGGGTPLTQTLENVMTRVKGERAVLLFILTDGEPNGGKDSFIRALRRICAPDFGHKVRVQIMACTAEDDEIGWLNAVDRELKEVDVTDDYHAEQQEVLRAGVMPKFTRGDWCMKAMLGPVSHKFDQWDEKLHPSRHQTPNKTADRTMDSAAPQCAPCVVQ